MNGNQAEKSGTVKEILVENMVRPSDSANRSSSSDNPVSDGINFPMPSWKCFRFSVPHLFTDGCRNRRKGHHAEKSLIASRAIAIRVLGACRRNGHCRRRAFRADKDSLHVGCADESCASALPLRANFPPNVPAIIAASKLRGRFVRRTHLAENADFAEQVEQSATFIGPKRHHPPDGRQYP